MHTSNGRIVLRDLGDLGQFRDLVVVDQRPTAESPARDDATPGDRGSSLATVLQVPVAPVAPDEVAALAATLEAALAELRAVTEADAQARQQAAAARTNLRRLEDAATRLDEVVARAAEAEREAVRMSERALAPEDRGRAAYIANTAHMLAATAQARAAAARDQATALADRPEVARLLDEEREAAAATEREAEEHRREEQFQEALAQMHALVAEGKENEARRMLGVLAKAHPNSPEPASLTITLDRRAQAVKTGTADQALRQARRVARRAPDAVLALLGPLDLDGVPDGLAWQVYGCWLAACRRVAPPGARHYSPRFGRGAVLIPADDGRLAVLAAIGLPEWAPSRRFSPSALRGARPL
jgi:hypothetical protein